MGQNREQLIEKGIDGLITLITHIKSVRSVAAWLTELLQKEKMFIYTDSKGNKSVECPNCI